MADEKRISSYAAPWHMLREAMSRFTANVEDVVDRVVMALRASAPAPTAAFTPRRILLPSGRDATELLHTRRRSCVFASIADNWDSEDETDGSEDAFSMDCDALCDDEDEDVDMAFSISEHMERAHAARVLQRTYRLWRRRAAKRRDQSMVVVRGPSPRPLKRKRSEGFAAPSDFVWRSRAIAQKLLEPTDKQRFRALMSTS
ncbi:hypothetical protein SDRG_09906 [Saprolegnia diclina VS20]|uniref:Uncharacterized protein n=1 Tax=Saprolegnia diclina (strain VS20) TaxID=1156394 RepID=T0Q433_SAPDV|nr:hypothetical protein SDRG_09906 [Saprolegnia diclina VS20]EQC32589.1 hypothetical protein SDRG_09906 [Saprolegnia diclina VS20]|eukprot:XP_008614090.1 hypothetical protein SDRG_09906 [Saprolegnia diclina VS20]